MTLKLNAVTINSFFVYNIDYKGINMHNPNTTINQGINLKALLIMTDRFKSWLRTSYSWVSEFKINPYLYKFCRYINRSQMKEKIFNNVISSMVNAGQNY